METEHGRTRPAKHARTRWQKSITRTRTQHEHPNTALRTPYCDYRWRPYRVECTGSLPTSEVKRRRARLVLGWGTAREDLRVLPALHTHQNLKTQAPNESCTGAISTGTRWRPYRAECTGPPPTSEIKVSTGTGGARPGNINRPQTVRTALQAERMSNTQAGAKTTNREQPQTQRDNANRPNNTTQFIDRAGVHKTSRGFEPRSLDSESRVLTVTPRGQIFLGYGINSLQ